MNRIIELSEKINICSDINKKMIMISELNELIKIEKEYLYSQRELNINPDIKIPVKYNKKTIEELEDLFNSIDDIKEKIIIYTAINNYYNNKLNELFC
jgi:hypothetical protein